MSPQPIPMDPKSILELVIKRRWFVLVPLFLAMIVGIYLAVKLPRIYQASTLILIQPQKVPKNYVQPIVSNDPGDSINTLSQQILSRTNLGKIIDQFKLYQGPAYKGLYEEDKIANLRKDISVTVSHDQRRQSDAFTIAYQGRDPQKVMQITNTLASYFIDENLRFREARAVGTSDFLHDELLTMEKRLEGVEAKLKNYRQRYMGELPEQLDSNLNILNRLQDHLNEAQQSLSDAKIKLASLQNVDSDLKAQTTTVIVGQNNPDDSTNLTQLKAQLDSLLARYTPRYPDVIRLKAKIAELEKNSQQSKVADGSTGKGDAEGRPASAPLPPNLLAQQFEIKQDIQRLADDIADTQKQIAVYQKRVDDTPKREQQLVSLNRNYSNIKKTYDSLLSRKLEADIAVNMERKQQGEQFRVVDPAALPQKPIKPDMKKLFALIVGAGLGVGAGIIFLLEYLDQTIKRPEEIEEGLKLPLLCTVPRIASRRRIIWRTVERVGFAIFAVLTFSLFSGFAILYLKGVDHTLDVLRVWVGS